VTSADSGALVIDMITSGAAENPPVWQRIFWAVSAGSIAAVLLLAGGLEALQTAAIASALPFAVVMIFIAYGLYRALRMETLGTSTDLSLAQPPAPAGPVPELSWQQRLTSIMGHFGKEEITRFLVGTARPALEAVAAEMRTSGFAPELAEKPDGLELTVPHGERGAFRYAVRSRPFLLPSFVWAESRKAHEAEARHYRAMAHTSEGETPHDVTGFSREQLINDLLNRYARFRHSRRLG
jgi:choline/glycine/proline betaine transport protein